MRIDVPFTPLGLGAGDLAGRGVVVVDALRATTTIITALANGAKAVIPAATSEEAVRLASNLEKDGVLLAGERRSVRMEGFALGNSPREMVPAAVAGKTIVLATTNGTPALVAAQGGEPVLVGAPVNFKALVERARAVLLAPRDLVIICAGREKQFAIEDAYTAGRVIKAVKKGLRKLALNDAARAALALTDELTSWTEALEGSEAAHQLGDGWALAAFERLGRLSSARTAALGVGLVLLLPYGIGTVTGARFPADYALWSPTQRLVGVAPALVAHGIHHAVGTAGGALVGLFALSALGILTVGWHPLVALRTRETAGVKARGKAGEGGKAKEEKAEVMKPEASVRLAPSPQGRKPKLAPPARPAVTPAGVLIPPIELLNPAPPEDGDAGLVQIEQMGQKLIETLQTFRVEGSIAGRTVGPVVTQYEVAPGPGVKVGRIAALADDLALAMRAPSLRIVAPIPGKAAVGIEVPNPMPRMVHVRELIEGADYQRSTRALPIALGKNLEGDPVVADLAKMPHLLIAGVTGSGKSVCINTIITSLIYTHPPEKLKLLMIDPKMVELSMYAALPHLGLPVVTNHHKAASVLKWAVWEMDRRYRLLHANHARNIVDFNKKVEEKKPLKGPRETLATQAGIQKELPLDGEYTGGIFPYIVLIVDELADLMLTVQGEIETPLATLAQKARAIGIHLVLATQRPSVNVITGLIKANFPCRIAFRVSATVGGRTLLDQNGAETRLGTGDMLFLPPGKSELVRVH